MTTETLTLPRIKVRGRSFMALIVAPEFPMSSWFEALDRQVRGAADFFEGRPVVADLTAALREGGPAGVHIVLDGLEARNLRLIGVEGVDPALLAGTRWERLPKIHGRDLTREEQAPQPRVAVPPSQTSLVIDRPVRSGQSVVFEDGDVTIVGSVGSGAEVIAGGSIHVYGALRGRAIAGLRSGQEAGVFCRRLEAEMVGVGRLYRTAEHWGPELHGRAVQVRCDRGALRLTAFD